MPRFTSLYPSLAHSLLHCHHVERKVDDARHRPLWFALLVTSAIGALERHPRERNRREDLQ